MSSNHNIRKILWSFNLTEFWVNSNFLLTVLSIILSTNGGRCNSSWSSDGKSVSQALTHVSHVLSGTTNNSSIKKFADGSNGFKRRLSNVESQEIQPQLANVWGARANFGVASSLRHSSRLEIGAIFVFHRIAADSDYDRILRLFYDCLAFLKCYVQTQQTP